MSSSGSRQGEEGGGGGGRAREFSLPRTPTTFDELKHSISLVVPRQLTLLKVVIMQMEGSGAPRRGEKAHKGRPEKGERLATAEGRRGAEGDGNPAIRRQKNRQLSFSFSQPRARAHGGGGRKEGRGS